MFGKRGEYANHSAVFLHSSNILWRIQTKTQKKPVETFKETSRSLIKERVNKWPSSILLDSDDDDYGDDDDDDAV
jgi:hypothetical protein